MLLIARRTLTESAQWSRISRADFRDEDDSEFQRRNAIEIKGLTRNGAIAISCIPMSSLPIDDASTGKLMEGVLAGSRSSTTTSDRIAPAPECGPHWQRDVGHSGRRSGI
jgi:hypothetical protein